MAKRSTRGGRKGAKKQPAKKKTAQKSAPEKPVKKQAAKKAAAKKPAVPTVAIAAPLRRGRLPPVAKLKLRAAPKPRARDDKPEVAEAKNQTKPSRYSFDGNHLPPQRRLRPGRAGPQRRRGK